MNAIDVIIETTQAIAADSSNAEAYKKRATVLCQMQQWDEALKDLDTLIDTLSVNDAELYAMRGHIRMNLGNKPLALSDFKQALTLNPDLMKQFDGEFKGTK